MGAVCDDHLTTPRARSEEEKAPVFATIEDARSHELDPIEGIRVKRSERTPMNLANNLADPPAAASVRSRESQRRSGLRRGAVLRPLQR